MKTIDYCSYELSKQLKAAGFDEPCEYGYSVKMRLEPEVSFGEPKMVHSKDPKNYNDNRKGIEKGLSFCSAVPLWQAQKWLREKKGIAINVIAHDGGKYSHEHVYLPNYDESTTQWGIWHINHTPLFDTYEEALSAGIAEILRLLVGKESEQS